MPLTNAQLCSELEVLQIPSLSAINGTLRKVAMLQSLAGVLESAGDLLGLPNISNLVAVSLIDSQAYDQIRESCINPTTGDSMLPDLSTNPSGVGDLQAATLQGYQAIMDILNSHPHNSLSTLQSQIDALLGQATSLADQAVGGGFNALDCLDQICSGAQGVVGTPQAVVSQGNRVTQSFDEFTAQGGKVLTTTQQEKMYNLEQTKKTVQGLMQ